MSGCPADMSGIHAPDEEGVCLNCDGGQDYNVSVMSLTERQSLERSGGGTSQTRFILASMNSVPPLSDAEQDALIEWLNSTGRVRKAMTAGVLADLYRVVASIAHSRASDTVSFQGDCRDLDCEVAAHRAAGPCRCHKPR